MTYKQLFESDCGSIWQMVLSQNKSFWLLWTQTSFWSQISWDSHVFLYTTLDPTGMSGKWWAVTSWWPLLWFLPVAELFLWFIATQEQITCSELGAYFGLSINIVLVWLIAHLSWTGCCDTVGGLYRVFLHPSFFQSKLFILYYFLHWLDGGLSFAIAPCIIQGRYMLYKSPILCNTLKCIGSELESYISDQNTSGTAV